MRKNQILHLDKWCDALFNRGNWFNVTGVYVFLAALLFGVMEIHADRDDTIPGNIPIYLMSNGIHTDIVMPMRNQIMIGIRLLIH